jgi:hypothetical protein
MAMTVDEIVATAQAKAKEAGQNSDMIIAQMGAIPPHAALMKYSLQADTLAFSFADAKTRGQKIFDKFETYVHDAVCTDFNYCSKRQQVDADLKKYLPDIVKAIANKLPTSGQVPGWLGAILAIFGITASSVEVIVTLFVAWLIIKGCDAMCHCA